MCAMSFQMFCMSRMEVSPCPLGAIKNRLRATGARALERPRCWRGRGRGAGVGVRVDRTHRIRPRHTHPPVMQTLIHPHGSTPRHNRLRHARLPQRPRRIGRLGQPLLRHRLLHPQPSRIPEIMPIDPAIDLRAPQPRPRHAGQRQEQQHCAHTRPRNRMQIAPEQPLRRLAAHADHPAASPARPPQIHTGQHQHDCPAGRHFDQPARKRPDQLQAVQPTNRPGQGAMLGQRAGARARYGST